jgi:tripartite ATP-independent transporter DctM subunit
MSDLTIGMICFAALFLLIFWGMHIGFAMAFIGFVGFAILGGVKASVSMLGLVPYSTIASYTFSVLPLFLLMGEFASISGLMRDMYYAVYAWLGRVPGGLAMATIGGSAGFGAVSGSSIAGASTMCRIALPEMRAYHYDDKLSTGTIAAGGTLAILIPPSLVFIIYGFIAEQSVGKLFLAGILPGIVLSVIFMTTIYVVVRMKPDMAPPGPVFSWRERWVATKGALRLLLLFVIVMGGIWAGIFTPTEAAAVGAFGSFVFVLIRKVLSKERLVSSLTGAISTTGMAFGILIGAMIFNNFVAISGLPTAMATFVTSVSVPPIGVLLCILCVYFILGCLMDTMAMILLTMPIFIPVILALGYDPIWFGVILTVMCEVGLITPPVGVTVFIVSGMSDVPMYDVFRGIAPFVISLLVFVAILILFPQLALFLPNTMMSSR